MVKQIVKRSEARLLVFLENAEIRFKYAAFMAHKLQTEYNFILLRLREMRMKGWIQRRRSNNKVYYTVTTIAPMKTARQVLHNGQDRKNKSQDT
jgi:hypothetical protein